MHKNNIKKINEQYFNAGVLLFDNTKKLRNKDITNMKETMNSLNYFEQDFLNMYFKFQKFNKEWNIVGDLDINQKSSLKIWHFTSILKPWKSIKKNKLMLWASMGLENKTKYKYKIKQSNLWMTSFNEFWKD